MSLGSASGSKATAGSPQKIILSVNTQLNNSFLPAVKVVANTATELLKATHAFQKASEAHAAAIRLLAESGRSGQSGTVRQAKALHELAKAYENVLNANKLSVPKLTFIATKTTTYSSGEKEKLKEIYANYTKKEKDLLKAEKKGTATQNADEFYAKEAAYFCNQQEMRYKFFVDKHREWLQSYGETIKTARSLLDLTSVEIEKLKEDNKEEVKEKRNDEHEESKEEKKEEIAEKEEVKADELKEKEQANEKTEDVGIETPVLDQVHDDHNQHHHHQDVQTVEHGQNHLTNGDREIAVEDQPAVDQIEPQVKSSTKYIELAHQRGMAVPVFPAMVPSHDYRPLQPVHVSPPPTAPRQMHYDVHVQPDYQNHTDPIPVVHTVHHTQPVVISPVSSLPSPVAPPKPKIAATPPPVAITPPVADHSLNGAITTGFAASDYGKTLVVMQDFLATSGEQLTVNRGDKVILIKSGTRGWIFIRDCVSQRTGWMPAPYASAP